ncbi:MAG: bacillithiol biosynthesis deacetylase BshB1, partial [Proteobacteria bacterium]
TIAALTAAGKVVVVVDLTDGEPTPQGSKEIRKQETEQANEILQISERYNLDLKNREVFDTVENRKKLAAIIREVRPKLLCIPYWEDGHPDHIQSCALGEAARFYAKLVKSDLPHAPHYPRKILHYFCTHIRPKIQPSFVFDITAQIDRKMRAIEAYRSQFIINQANSKVLEWVRTESAHWGFQIGVEFGEPFIGREHIRIPSPDAFLNV